MEDKKGRSQSKMSSCNTHKANSVQNNGKTQYGLTTPAVLNPDFDRGNAMTVT